MEIPRRISSTIINALSGGVVPRIGLSYVTVGREAEIGALLHDAELVAEGGASFRFICGKYGAGKSFLLQAIRNKLLSENFVVADADLSPERRIHGTNGQGLATYKELIGNLATKPPPEGGALSLVLDRWIDSLCSETAANTGLQPDSTEFAETVKKRIFEVVNAVSELVHGFDFARLLSAYYNAYINEDAELKGKVLKWFRGEYSGKTEAKNELGINIVITDNDWYDYIKLFAFFFKQAGYAGFIVLIDELVNIYKIPNAVTRQYNYEKILTMFNDTLQGRAKYLGILLCGTPQCIEDTRRGVYSYEALRSRLTTGKFGGDEGSMLLSPVIKLRPLTKEELVVLCIKLTEIHASLFKYAPQVTREDCVDFISAEFSRVGAESNITPREVIRDFIELLNRLMSSPGETVRSVISSSGFSFAAPEGESEDVFAEFTV